MQDWNIWTKYHTDTIMAANKIICDFFYKKQHWEVSGVIEIIAIYARLEYLADRISYWHEQGLSILFRRELLCNKYLQIGLLRSQRPGDISKRFFKVPYVNTFRIEYSWVISRRQFEPIKMRTHSGMNIHMLFYRRQF